MKVSISSEDYYNLMIIDFDHGENRIPADKLQRFVPTLKKSHGIPCIVSFSVEPVVDDNFLKWVCDLNEFMNLNGIIWILNAPVTGHIDFLDENKINFAPTTEEAIDMAIMICVEQEFRDESEEDQ